MSAAIEGVKKLLKLDWMAYTFGHDEEVAGVQQQIEEIAQEAGIDRAFASAIVAIGNGTLALEDGGKVIVSDRKFRIQRT